MVIGGITTLVTWMSLVLGDTAAAVTDAFLLKVTVNDELQTVAENQLYREMLLLTGHYNSQR